MYLPSTRILKAATIPGRKISIKLAPIIVFFWGVMQVSLLLNLCLRGKIGKLRKPDDRLFSTTG